MKIRILETTAKYASPHGLRGSSPAPVLPAGEAVATPPADCASRGQGAFYTAAAFVDEWVSPRTKAAPVPRDFTFKAVIGEPSW